MNLSKGWLDHAVNLLRQASGFALQKVRKSSNFTQYANSLGKFKTFNSMNQLVLLTSAVRRFSVGTKITASCLVAS